MNFKSTGVSAPSKKDRYQELVEHLPVGVYRTTKDGHIIEANQALADMLGFCDPDEIKSVKATDLYVERADRRSHIETLKKLPTESKEFELRKKDGRTIWVRDHTRAVLDADGRVAFYDGILEDITPIRSAHDEVARSEGRYREIVELAPDGIVTLDIHGTITSCNSAFLDMAGYSKDEILGRLFTRIPIIIEKHIPIHLKQFKSIIEGRNVNPFDFSWIRKDGEFRRGEVRVSLLRKGGAVVGMQAVLRDMTERRWAEEKLKSSLVEKDLLLQEVHHRVKNNLQMMLSLLNLQSRYIKDKMALEIFRETEDRIRSIAIIHQRLYKSEDLARIDFSDYVESLAEHLFCTFLADPKSIRLSVDIADVCLDLNAAIPCGLIVNELISNSLKHAFPLNRRGEIGIRLAQNGDPSYVLEIWDNGVGFPADLHIDRTESLGLQLVYMLVKQLGGSLKLDRKRGARFSITFPKKKTDSGDRGRAKIP